MRLTIGIKAFNEERHIAAALSSAISAAAPFNGEVVLADCGSTDRTVEIAQSYPVRIVRLADPSQRSCGAGAQLAFQHATGEYFYMLDGDMVLDPGFLPAAIAFLDANQNVAGVGGRVCEINIGNQEAQIRVDTISSDQHRRPGIVDRLDGGGLFRSVAIKEAGYFADCNLHGFEEFELAARLQSRGWKLARIDRPAVDHFGYEVGGYRLLWQRLKSGYAWAPGEVLRGALGHPHLPIVLCKLGHIRNSLAVIGWWALLLACIVGPIVRIQRLSLLLLLMLGPVFALTWRRGSLSLGFYSFVAWNVVALGLLIGLLRQRVSPTEPLAAVTLQQSGQ